MSFGGILAAGIGAVGSLAGGLFTNQANANLNYRNRKWQEEMWQKQNEYNTPSAVLGRFSDAGIQVNPNYLVTGNYDGGLAGSVGTPDQQAYKNPADSLASSLGLYFENKRIENETKVAESQAHVNETQAANNEANTAGKINENRYFLDNYETQLENQLQELELKKKNGLILDEQYKIKTEELKKEIENVRRAKAEADKAEEEVKTQEAQTNYLISETELNNEKVVTEKTTQLVNQSQAEYFKAQKYATIEGVKLTQAQAGYYHALKNKTNQETVNLRENKKLIIAQTQQILEQAGLTKQQAYKTAVDTLNAVADGKVERAMKILEMELKNTSQRYGTSMIGSTIGVCLDVYTNYMNWRQPSRTYNKSHGSTTTW